ncbi:MAG: methylenetetrahydrofolate--tRNA-(uracil(54)-C(5))-methyltransferase (FADH(2)-oxidizing) TrmFO [Gemmatimonadales bacterium]
MTATVLGGGLAGCEAAWALAERGVRVRLIEMRPAVPTPAHKTDRLAELVCSNTFKSTETTNAHGLLKAELRLLGSLLLPLADEARVPGGSALAVDREVFSRLVTERITSHRNIEVVREEATTLPDPGIVATGPLTSDALSGAIESAAGTGALAFYDAIAPIVSADSLGMERLFKASRYGKGDGDDYWNAPMSREDYAAFIAALTAADRYPGHEFEQVPYFEGCLPVEEMASRGSETLRFGPMKPVGLMDPASGHEPFAVVQLRQEDRAAQMWNLVGFQTRLRSGEQQRVFRMIPGLERAEFLRFGSIHRNSYLNAPKCLSAHLALEARPRTLFAGQITGVEGYTESLGTGLLAGLNLARILKGTAPRVPPAETMLGALVSYVHGADPAAFQPMNANFGLLPPPPQAPKDKAKKKQMLAERALAAMTAFVREIAA